MANCNKMQKVSELHWAGRGDETALSHLGIRWERASEPYHDYCFFLKRSRDEQLLATSSSAP